MDYFEYIRAIRSSDLPGIAKLTAIMIASHFDFSKGDPAFPTNKLLAKETGFSISAIVKAKKVLSDRGYLYSHRRWDNSCEYTPMLPESIDYSTRNSLNTHINTQLNTQLNTKRNNITSINKNQNDEVSLDINSLAAFEDGSPAASGLIDWFG